MRVKTVDGKAIFATHEVEILGVLDINKIDRLQYERDTESVICYSEEELEKVKSIIQKENVDYNIITLDTSIQTISEGVSYNNRSELIEHLQNGITPEKMIIKNLKSENEDLKARLEATENALLEMMGLV